MRCDEWMDDGRILDNLNEDINGEWDGQLGCNPIPRAY
jgi:hypothetical protein